MKEFQQSVIQLKGENIQFQEQLETSKPMKNTLYDFRRCVLEQIEELHKLRQNLYIHIQKLQDTRATFKWFKDNAQNSLIQITRS